MSGMIQSDGKKRKSGGNRVIEMDYLKVLAIIFMTIIHVMELCSRDYPADVLPKGNFQFVLSFLLMICTDCFVVSIGFGYSFTRNKAPGDVARRGCRLIVLGYVLNFLRACLPYAITSMLRAEFHLYTFLEYLLAVDVLQFAGAAYLLLALLTSLHMPQWTLIPLSFTSAGRRRDAAAHHKGKSGSESAASLSCAHGGLLFSSVYMPDIHHCRDLSGRSVQESGGQGGSVSADADHVLHRHFRADGGGDGMLNL